MRLAWGVALLCAVACARSGSGDTTAAGDGLADGRFPHAKHRDVACTDCHALDAVLAGTPARPGADDHAPCDREQCHAEAFAAPPGPLCTGCHDEVDPTGATPTTLAPYPPRHGRRALAAEFSHATHLDYARMERTVGFHVACRDCHPADDERRALPDHATCARCHAGEAAADGAPTMSSCDSCHFPRTPAPVRARSYIVGDLHFSHARHETDRAGRAIACGACHTRVAEVKHTARHPAPETAACVVCHDDEARTPSSARMRTCETCHLTRSEFFGALAPRSHLPPTERPEDHTLAFRTDHATEAGADSRRCARCHTQLSGSTRDTCDECHQVMRPRDHTAGWREYEHGPEAATDRERCASCHTAGFCVACHARPPRSHFPMMEFIAGGHAAAADLNLRACLVCHGDVARDCAGPGCHQ